MEPAGGGWLVLSWHKLANIGKPDTEILGTQRNKQKEKSDKQLRAFRRGEASEMDFHATTLADVT